ncbi:cytochrome c3 family protein [uncultured Erythrobacter sp.]|uniref:cytochrome c3 family protein n=1 Tax=uncultured Erythrobacter sp. TaxID=263913 RepID=UPI0026377393|nr:cytochrome c3 family protein [uncultured Erythrobacter sp.]
MAFLIRTIATAKSGRKISRDRTVENDQLIVGRAPESDIHLPDLAVDLRHVGITIASGGLVNVEALGTLDFGLDGKMVDSGVIDPAAGGEIAVGAARLAVSSGDDDGKVQIVIKQVDKGAAAVDPVQGFALASALPSKRGMAWVFAALILVLLLSVPVITHLLRSPVENDPENLAQGQVVLDSAWSAGELSMAHHELEENCEACHVTPFVSVQDETCLTCHEELGDHAEMPRLAEGMAPLSRGDAIQWSIGETLGKEGPLGCVSCHSEHEGPVVLEAASEQFCADCHDALDTRLSNPNFGNASDFGEKHPQFRPQFYTAHFADEPARVSLDDNPQEMSGLIFPHDIHVDEQGGVARMAISLGQYGAPLECSDCHSEWKSEDLIIQVAETGGRPSQYGDFAPVNMEASCEACHSLVSGRAGDGFTSLRHGDVDDLMEDLASLDRGPRRPVVSPRGRPGQFAPGGRYNANFGRPMSAYIAINRALEPTGVCGECHIPTSTDGRRDLTPVNLPHRFLMQGYFDHAAHGDDVAVCTDCHTAETSGEATDLLIPDLASCRDCHLGESAVKTEEITPSSCAMCHGYHTPTTPWRPEDHPNLPGNGGNDSVAAILSSLRR